MPDLRGRLKLFVLQIISGKQRQLAASCLSEILWT
jgi:hypothetical protein